MEKLFKLSENGTTVRTEVFAGMTTFFAMVYILFVNAGMLGSDVTTATGDVLYQAPGFNAIFIATAISAIASTLVMAFVANMPFALASGMGLNAFFVYNVCVGFGFSYANALILVLFDGILFIILTVTGLRKKILYAIPESVRKAIGPGIGLFLAFLGLQNAGIIIPSSSTGVTLASFNLLTGSLATIMPLVIVLVTFFTIITLSHFKVKGSVIIGILVGTALYYLIGLGIEGFYPLDMKIGGIGEAFKEFGTFSFGKVFTEGFNFSAYQNAHGTANLIVVIATSALAFCMTDMFDTLGTFYGACESSDMMDEKGEIKNINKAMLADAIGTTVGAVCGTSTVTTFAESTAGIAAGGKTGLTALVTAGLFFIAMFLSPLAKLVPGVATAASLIFVGFLMLGSVSKLDWKDYTVAVPAFLTIIMMPFTYNISFGIAFGLFAHIVIMCCTKRFKEINIGTWIIAALFLATILLTH